MLAVLGRRQATLAVPEPARALVVAAIESASTRHPLVVAVPTTAEAERLVGELGTSLGPDRVDLFPAWETLPFERVSPSVETMGRRMRAMWRLRAGEATGVGAAAPALGQRRGP